MMINMFTICRSKVKTASKYRQINNAIVTDLNFCLCGNSSVFVQNNLHDPDKSLVVRENIIFKQDILQ